MISFEAARSTILQHVSPLEAERVHLPEAVGRVLAEDLAAPRDMPLWDNSAMDGYAVSSRDCMRPPCVLRVSGNLAAGCDPGGLELEPGSAVRIMTGAPIPKGCDAVVPVEETDNGTERVTLESPVRQGQHVRLRGEDVAAGETFLSAGMLLRPPEVSMLAAFGMAQVSVHRQPRVAILSTGDELVELGKIPGPGQLIDSNSLALAAAVREAGGIPVALGIARDSRESLREKLLEGLLADALITSAGVSAGDLDLVRDVLAEAGGRQLFWQVAIKPGGPTAFALHGELPVFSLPGNPVSSLITFEEFVRPALLRMQGRRQVLRPLFKAVLADGLTKKPGKVQIVRVRLERRDGVWHACSAGNQQTAILKTMVAADALAVLPAESTHFGAGDAVDVHFYGNHQDQV